MQSKRHHLSWERFPNLAFFTLINLSLHNTNSTASFPARPLSPLFAKTCHVRSIYLSISLKKKKKKQHYTKAFLNATVWLWQAPAPYRTKLSSGGSVRRCLRPHKGAQRRRESELCTSLYFHPPLLFQCWAGCALFFETIKIFFAGRVVVRSEASP